MTGHIATGPEAEITMWGDHFKNLAQEYQDQGYSVESRLWLRRAENCYELLDQIDDQDLQDTQQQSPNNTQEGE